MDDNLLKRSYLAAAVAVSGIIGAIVLYTVIVEILRHIGHKPPLAPPAAYVVKYALYVVSISSVFIVNLVSSRLSAAKPTPEETVKALTAQAIVKAALCELPAVSGLILAILTGFRSDFYLLIVFSIGLEIYHFPRLAQWEERIRTDFGQL